MNEYELNPYMCVHMNMWSKLLQAQKSVAMFKACVRYFYQIFIFSPNDSPSKTMKNAFCFI